MRHLASTRLTIGLAQGGTLWWLYRALEDKAWPATEPILFAPLVMTAIYVPILALLGFRSLRIRMLLAWTAAAAALCAGLAVHDVLRADLATTWPRARLPGPALWFVLPAMLFMAHVLIGAGDSDHKAIGSYRRHFDLAWKLGLQLALAPLFVGVFWLLLWLGTELFRLIRIEIFHTVIQEAWFWVPVTTLMFSLAVHVADTQENIVRGVRTLALSLFGWLLPMIALIAVAFLVALPFTGLEPIWSTRRATTLMLVAAGALVFLLNAAYQDGDPQRRLSPLLRWSGRAAALALGPVVVIAAYALMLRIHQYGWTPERIFAAACIVAAGCYAVGYAVAALQRGSWLKGVEVTNVATSFVILGLLIALFTPLADPYRLAVQSQTTRLLAGRVAPEQFDFQFLRFRSGRYGREALEQLRVLHGGPDQDRIARLAQQALDPRFPGAAARPPVTAADRAANITVLHPRGQAIPDGFLQQDWNAARSRVALPPCLTFRGTCEAVLVDLDRDGTAEILLFTTLAPNPTHFGFGSVVFRLGPDQIWTAIGTIGNTHCPGVRDAVRNGQLDVLDPEPKDLGAAGHRLRITPPCG